MKIDLRGFQQKGHTLEKTEGIQINTVSIFSQLRHSPRINRDFPVAGQIE